jgi:hypothetical protein
VDYGQAARNHDRVEMIRGMGGEVIEVKPKNWGDILNRLGALGICSVMVEGGAEVINGLLEARNQKYTCPQPCSGPNTSQSMRHSALKTC